MRIVVIGVGTAHGDDAAGTAVVERLARGGVPSDVRAVACGRPIPDLLDAFERADAALLVDATRTGRTPGTVWRPTPERLRRAATSSSHGLGVAQALDLAAALGRVPRRLAVVGIEAASAQPGASPSPAVRDALPEAERVVRSVLAAWGATEEPRGA